MDVEDLFTNYVYPQENGNRTDTMWVSLTTNKGDGLFIKGSRPIDFSAHYYTTEDIETATHQNKLRKREFVIAATVTGSRDWRIMWRHILPNALAPVLVSASFGIAGAILVEASLSFLGFGVPPSDPSWGSMLSQAQQFMDIAWWLTLIPGFAIFMTITAYNLIGEALRDAIDPNLRT